MSFIEKMSETLKDEWHVTREGYSLEDEANQETLFTLSNGYMGVRGAIELPTQGNCRATYLAGVYDKQETRGAFDERMVIKQNKAITPAYAIVPDTNIVEIQAEGESFDFMNCEIMECRRVLDMIRGVTINSYTLKSRRERVIQVKTFNLVSKVRKHITMCRIEITPLNFEGKIIVRFGNNLCTNPQSIRRLNDYISKTDLVAVREEDSYVCVSGKVVETGMLICAMSHTIGFGSKYAEYVKDGIKEVFETELKQGQTVEYVKFSCLYSSRDTEETIVACQRDLEAAIAAGEDVIIEEHTKYWKQRWRVSDVQISKDTELQVGIRWNIFHLIQVGSEDDQDVSISATGLHGQGYFGHAFWDTEIFMLPFFLATNVDVARNLLMYRYNRLDQARNLAGQSGFSGAKFPWTSAFSGADVTPPDWDRCAKRQIHISGDVAYAFRNFYDQTGDWDFYVNYGMEVIVETAKFYASKTELGEDSKYHILDVIGPDEYNIHANDNYYTNHLAAWNMKEAIDAMQKLEKVAPEQYHRIAERTGWDKTVEEKLQEIVANIAYPRTYNFVNEQYNGFFDLNDVEEIERNEFNMPIGGTHEYLCDRQVLKQADVVMMHYLFPADFSKEEKRESFLYYEKRCLHGSSLSPSIHCITGLRNGFGKFAYGYLYLTALLDLKNLHMDKNLFEGLHAACAGGTWAAVVYGFGGIEIKKNELHINPILPEEWTEMKYSFINKEVLFDVCVCKDKFAITSDGNAEFYVDEKKCSIAAGMQKEFVVNHSRYAVQ